MYQYTFVQVLLWYFSRRSRKHGQRPYFPHKTEKSPRVPPTAACSIGQAVSEQLEMPHLQGIASVVMVGGFSGSVHVQVLC